MVYRFLRDVGKVEFWMKRRKVLEKPSLAFTLFIHPSPLPLSLSSLSGMKESFFCFLYFANKKTVKKCFLVQNFYPIFLHL
jgi:hypothetical protein